MGKESAWLSVEPCSPGLPANGWDLWTHLCSPRDLVTTTQAPQGGSLLDGETLLTLRWAPGGQHMQGLLTEQWLRFFYTLSYRYGNGLKCDL